MTAPTQSRFARAGPALSLLVLGLRHRHRGAGNPNRPRTTRLADSVRGGFQTPAAPNQYQAGSL